tara:strand:+ start:827 stop:1021 length:195 start_codon:yes stop_codon:yes gene_type:complete
MSKISEIDLGSALLSACILLGYLATAIVAIRLTIIGINYIKVNFPSKEEKNTQKDDPKDNKGFS